MLQNFPSDGFVAAATELEAFLDRAWIGRKACVPGNLDTGYDAVLFYGLNIKKRIDIANDMAIFPFEQVQAFVEKKFDKGTRPTRRRTSRMAVGRSCG